MPSRRKLKKERELVADMKKTFENFCSKQNCSSIGCKYFYEDDCCSAYIIDLLKNTKTPIVYMGRGDGKFNYNQEKIKKGEL